jgi:hypothetical protein
MDCILTKNSQDVTTKCLSSHMVCSECYKKSSECPYCRCGYILTFGCDHRGSHNTEVASLSH